MEDTQIDSTELNIAPVTYSFVNLILFPISIPMHAGSAKMALNVLTKAGVAQQDLMFLNLICCPEGLANLYDEYPKIK